MSPSDRSEPVRPAEGTDLRLVGRLVDASNATFLARFDGPDGEVDAVYKPIAGEVPLWDFPARTLAFREVAAFELSQVAGFDMVPDTFLIEGAPYGPGSLQLWVEPDPLEVVDVVAHRDCPEGWFIVVDGVDHDERPVQLVHADDPRLRRLCLFDVLANNADRKGGHVIVSGERLVGVDHGVCFNAEPKLRTVLWGWAGEPLTDEEVALVRAARENGRAVLEELLDGDELDAFERRCDVLLRRGRLPEPGHGWPSIPWPPL